MGKRLNKIDYLKIKKNIIKRLYSIKELVRAGQYPANLWEKK